MNQKERLVEVLDNSFVDFIDFANRNPAEKTSSEFIADYILADGWVRPPVKVGDKVYKPWKAGGRNVVAEFVVVAIISAISNQWSIKYKKVGGTICYQADMHSVGKELFTSREDVEKA